MTLIMTIKIKKLQQFISMVFLALALVSAHSCYASYGYDGDDSHLGTWIGVGALGVGAAAVVALILNSKSSSPSSTAQSDISAVQLPVINSSSSYNLLSVNGSKASGSIVVTNQGSQRAARFNITQSGAASVTIDPNSSCYQTVSAGGQCTFNISYTGTAGSTSSVPVLFTVGNDANSDAITVKVINQPANVFFDPTVVGTYASSIYVDSNTRQTNFVTVSKNGVNFIYVGTNGGVFKTNDAGISWMAVNNQLTNTDVTALYYDGVYLYAGTNGGGVFKTSNGGASWVAVNNGLTGAALQVQTLYLCSGALYVGTNGGGVFKTSDGGNNWQVVGSGLENLTIKTLYSDGISLYAGILGGGVYKLAVDGNSWVVGNGGLTELALNARSLCSCGGSLYVGTDGGVYKLGADGSAWTAVNGGLAGLALNVQTLYSYGGSLYAGTNGGGVYKLEADGATWSLVGLRGGSVVSLYSDGASLYAGVTSFGVWKINSGSNQWVSTSNRLANKISALCKFGNCLFTGGGLLPEKFINLVMMAIIGNCLVA